MVIQVELFNQKTARGEERLCFRFDRKPNAALLRIIKEDGGARYRKGSGGNKACWYLPPVNAATLQRCLSIATQDEGGDINTFLSALSAHLGDDNADECSSHDGQQDSESELEEGEIPPEPPLKRRRTAECPACAYERRMSQDHAGAFAQCTIEHTCGRPSQ